jgi:protein SCO1/2
MTCFFLVSCGGPSKGVETRYELKGKVVSVDREKGQVVIDHEPIPGFMEGMVMPFPLPDRDALGSIEARNQIQATLVVTDKGYWIENPIITKSAITDPSAEISSREPKIGAEAPDASLVNQDGRRVTLKQYRGRALLITFIYTRCPLADYCPLMSSNFAALNRELEKDTALAARVHLLSVTLDPEFDKPEVLRSYGAAHTEKYSDEKFARWSFATGDSAEIRRLAEFFGVTYVKENGQITHSLRTVLITPDGKIFKVYRGNEWKPEEALTDIRLALDQKTSA